MLKNALNIFRYLIFKNFLRTSDVGVIYPSHPRRKSPFKICSLSHTIIRQPYAKLIQFYINLPQNVSKLTKDLIYFTYKKQTWIRLPLNLSRLILSKVLQNWSHKDFTQKIRSFVSVKQRLNISGMWWQHYPWFSYSCNSELNYQFTAKLTFPIDDTRTFDVSPMQRDESSELSIVRKNILQVKVVIWGGIGNK